MAAPLPLPRKISKGNAFASDSTDHESSFNGSPAIRKSSIQLVHTVDVHNTSIENGSASSENNLAIDKKRKKLRRKSTFSISKKQVLKSEESLNDSGDLEIQNVFRNDGSLHKKGNETFSEDSSSPSSNKIKLIPILESKKKKKPSGYATETLSDESDLEKNLKQSKDLHQSKSSASSLEKKSQFNEVVPKVTNNITETEDSDNKKMVMDSSNPSPPVPLPRSLKKSVESIGLEANQSRNESPQSYCTSSSLDYRDTGYFSKHRQKKHRKKKKLKDSKSENFEDSKEDLNSLHGDLSQTQQLLQDCNSGKSLRKSEKSEFICITIHRCEPLQIKDFSIKPYVKLIIWDVESGKAKINSRGDMIEPVATQPYDYTVQRSSSPHWNEDLIIIEPIDMIKSKNTILLITIINEEKNKVIAWGFLKPVAANGATNIGKMLRLQLFKPGKYSKDDSWSQVFVWWKNGGYKNYKSTLYLTLNPISENMIVKSPTGAQDKNIVLQKSPEKSIPEVTSEKEDKDLENVKWGRLPSLSCKLPNKYLARLPAGPDGSIAIAYSHSGLFLAAANKAAVCVYTFKGRLYLSLHGHHGLIYSLKWSSSDKYLLSASADFFACVWDISNKITSPIQTVSHPSYVYSCAWLDNNTFATGCFDNDIRVWKIGSTQLHQQASHHNGQINTLLFYDSYLLSGDSLGEICFWHWNPNGELQLERTLEIREIKGKVINKLSLHPGKKRLLVHTRDSVLRMVDITSGSVLHWFQGLVNIKSREDSTFCGCGSWVLAWSEDSTLCVWDANTGAQVAIYPGLIHDSQPGAVDFHPRDHMMAVSAHSSHTPVLSILTYDRLSNGREVGLVPLTGGISSIYYNSEKSSAHSSDRSTESTPKKKESLLKSLLGPKKKTKKDISSPSYKENSFTDFSRISNNASRVSLADSAPKESRLGDIIKRMDRILTSVSNNSSLYSS